MEKNINEKIDSKLEDVQKEMKEVKNDVQDVDVQKEMKEVKNDVQDVKKDMKAQEKKTEESERAMEDRMKMLEENMKRQKYRKMKSDTLGRQGRAEKEVSEEERDDEMDTQEIPAAKLVRTSSWAEEEEIKVKKQKMCNLPRTKAAARMVVQDPKQNLKIQKC